MRIMTKSKTTIDLPGATPEKSKSKKAPAAKDETQDAGLKFKITKLHDEVQAFFAFLKRVNPPVFGMVTPEFVTTALENFEEAETLHRDRLAKDAEARAAAMAENKAIRESEIAARRNDHINRIEAARKKNEEEQTALLNAQEELRQRTVLAQNPQP